MPYATAPAAHQNGTKYKDRYLLWVAVLAEQDTLLRFLNLVDEGNDFGVDGDMCMGIVVIVVGVQVLPTYSISFFS